MAKMREEHTQAAGGQTPSGLAFRVWQGCRMDCIGECYRASSGGYYMFRPWLIEALRLGV